MKQIILKRIRLENFQNWKQLEINFDEKLEVITAPYGSGKTTIYNGFLYGLGIDLPSGIEVVTKNETLELPSELIASCVLDLLIDDELFTFERYSNNKFKINGEKISTKKKYDESIEKIIGFDKSLITLLTKIETFNQENSKWKWNNRLEFLKRLFDIESKLSELKGNSCLEKYFKSGKSETEIKNVLAKNKRDINSEKNVLYRQYEDTNFKLKEQQESVNIDELIKEKQELEEKLNHYSTSNLYDEYLKKLEKESELSYVVSNLSREINNNYIKLDNLKDNYQLKQLKQFRENYKTKYSQLYTDLTKVLEKTFDENMTCKTCGNRFEPHTLAIYRERFENAKMEEKTALEKDLEQIYQSIISTNESINDLELKLANEEQELLTKISELQTTLTDWQNNYNSIKQEVLELKTKIDNDNTKQEYESNSEKYNLLIQEISKYENTIEMLRNNLSGIHNRIGELNNKEKENLIEEDALQEYLVNSKTIIESINENFNNGISFKFFNEKEDGIYDNECLLMLDGKPYDYLSFGEKIYANLLITQYLQIYSDINIPLFVDNANAFKVVNTNSQTILLLTKENEDNLNSRGIKATNYYERKE